MATREIRVRTFVKEDQEIAYKIWRDGMVEVSGEWIKFIVMNPIMLGVFALSALVPYFFGLYFWMIIPPTLLYFGLEHLVWKNVCEDYINGRTDMVDIAASFGDQFFVAELFENGKSSGVV